MSVQHCAIRVVVVFVSVGLIDVAKMVHLHVGSRHKQTRRSEHAAIGNKAVASKKTATNLLWGNNKEREDGRTNDSHCGNSWSGGADDVIVDRVDRAN